MRSRSYWDVAKDVTEVELGTYWSISAGNRNFWKGLETAQRKVLLDTMAETLVDTGIGYLSDVQDIVEEAKAKGVTFHTPGPSLADSLNEFKATAPTFAVELGSKKLGVEGAGELVARFEKIANKWRDLLKDVDRTDRAALLGLLREQVYGRIDPATYSMD